MGLVLASPVGRAAFTKYLSTPLRTELDNFEKDGGKPRRQLGGEETLHLHDLALLAGDDHLGECAHIGVLALGRDGLGH